ncbi:MAG: hypothetical protein HQL53_00035 [Magnetococcales bacterium]|nr:hypothetical protein [Magnetococcales bacterium]
MLMIKCAGCKRKLWKYQKLGKGEVHRCHKARMDRIYEAVEQEGHIACRCGQVIGLDKGSHYRMIRKRFSYSGSTVSKL